ncbi:hypothetical protein AOQ84DRAFT_20344 [Glonium stellatum]|uniref:Uncharacterized protein n=1 Tax=Glonium stellatum TaxID=574774 RepID=A0A8E2F2Q6_9PEZI|nr:hypothetical protein AOQ84DRAFT_20344 [Glonium stellatum]
MIKIVSLIVVAGVIERTHSFARSVTRTKAFPLGSVNLVIDGLKGDWVWQRNFGVWHGHSVIIRGCLCLEMTTERDRLWSFDLWMVNFGRLSWMRSTIGFWMK